MRGWCYTMSKGFRIAGCFGKQGRVLYVLVSGRVKSSWLDNAFQRGTNNLLNKRESDPSVYSIASLQVHLQKINAKSKSGQTGR